MTGMLAADKALVVRLLSCEERSLTDGTSQRPVSTPQNGVNSGKGTSKGKGAQTKGKGKGGKGKGVRSDRVMELYVCGGTTTAEVLVCEAWDESVRTRLKPLATPGDVLRISKCLVAQHQPKSKSHTTSRAQVYLKLVPETTFEVIGDVPRLLRYHPLTPFSSLVRLDDKTLVCLAGKVIPPLPSITKVRVREGEPEVDVAHLMLRNADEVVKVTFWSEQAALTNSNLLVEGQCVMLYAVAKQTLKEKEQVGIRAHYKTIIQECPAPLLESLRDTPSGADGATVITRDLGQRKDYTNEKAKWCTCSFLKTILESGQSRCIPTPYMVPSAFIEVHGFPTYMACSKCYKAWSDQANPPCACGEERMCRWRAKITIRDATAAVNAVSFESFAAVAEIAAIEAGDSPGALGVDIEKWQDETHVATSMSCVGAVPLTVLVTIDTDQWSQSMQLTLQVLQRTRQPDGVVHPMKSMVHLAPSEGACPPCVLSQASYDEALGLNDLYGMSLHCFRGVVVLRDDPPDMSGDGDTRDIACVFDAERVYKLMVEDDDVGKRLQEVSQDTPIHAVLSWQSPDRIAVTAFIVIPESDFEDFKKFFSQEIALQRNHTQAGPSISPKYDDTPCRIIAAADYVDECSSPAWKQRKLLE